MPVLSIKDRPRLSSRGEHQAHKAVACRMAASMKTGRGRLPCRACSPEAQGYKPFMCAQLNRQL